MPLQKLALDNLGALDERIVLGFELAVKQCVLDAMDRPGDKNARVVTMEMKIIPVVGEEGQCDGAEAEFQIKSKVPARKSKTYSFNVNRAGQMVFSDTNPENVNQSTFDDLGEDGRVNRRRPE